MESQPVVVHTTEDQEKQASLHCASVIIILTALAQEACEQRVNKREIRYLHLLEQRIRILERSAKAQDKHRLPIRRRVPKPSPVRKVG